MCIKQPPLQFSSENVLFFFFFFFLILRSQSEVQCANTAISHWKDHLGCIGKHTERYSGLIWMCVLWAGWQSGKSIELHQFWAANKMECMELKGWDCHPEAELIPRVTLLMSVPNGLSSLGEGFFLTRCPYSTSAPNIHCPTLILACRSLCSNARKRTPSATLSAKTINERPSNLPFSSPGPWRSYKSDSFGRGELNIAWCSSLNA